MNPNGTADERRRRLPLGAVIFATEVAVPVSRDELCALATDLPRYAAVEPRLQEARWLDASAPRAGSSAAVVGEIPFKVSIVRRVIGHPRGTAVLDEYTPPRRLVYSLDTERASGRMEIAFRDAPDGCVVAVDGWILPRSALGQLALAPVATALRPLASQAVRRGVLRAAAAVRNG